MRYTDTGRETAFRKHIYDTFGTRQYIGRNDNPRTGSLLTYGADIKAEFSVYSPIIMLVVIVVTAMVLSRTVRRESKSIG
nr:hypothetical protein [Ruminococcus sp.]